MRRLILLLALSLFSAATVAEDRPGKFDYYVLALSWSPDHCAEQPRDAVQCGRRLGLVLHGLWPQYERGFPEFCGREPLSGAVKAEFQGLYPSDRLFRHEWEKHGTCSGLSQRDYLGLSKKLKEGVVVPDAYRTPEQPFRTTSAALRKAVSARNRMVPEDAIAVFCSGSGRFFKEMYVCFDKQGKFALPCGRDILRRSARSCGQSDFLVRSVR